MKKMIAWLLLVVMLLGTFAGCGNTEQTPTTGGDNGAAAAIDYLKAFYKDAGTETFADFERFGIVRIAGVAYTVVWTADVSEDLVKAVVNEDGSVTIDVNESNETATNYKLTATVTDEAGNTASHSWEYILPVGLGNDYGAIVDMAYELESGSGFDFESTLVGTVTVINTAWSDEYKNITVTMVIEGREDKPIMCYRLKGDGAQDLAPGDLITVTGKLKNYNGTIEFDSGCTLDKVEKGAGTLGDIPTDPIEIIDAAFALEVGASLPYSATLTGEVVSIDTPYSADYNNVTVSIKVEGREDKPIMCYRMKGEGADQVMPGDTITVTGVIKNYNGTIEFDAGCSLDKLVKGENSFVMPTTTAEILELAYDLKPGEAIPVQVTLTGLIFKVDTPYSDRYNNISVWMVVDGMYDKPVMAFRLKGADVDKIWENDTITVTGTLKNYEGTIEFDAGCKLDSWVDTGINPDYPTTQKEIVKALYALGEGESFHGIYSLTGRVVEADPYSLNYGNQTITIDVEGYKVDVYRMTTGGIEIAEGDYVTVRGNLENYNGYKQMTSAYLTWYDETTLAEAMEEASYLGNGEYLSYNEVATGTISNVSYSAKYGNITFDLTDANGTTIKCYRVKGFGMDQWVEGDTVTVTGPLTAYKGTAQYDSKSSVVCWRIMPETLEEQLEAASYLPNGISLHVPSTITGKVSFIDSPYSEKYGNISFYVTNEDGVEVYCYRVKGDGMDTLALGDTVKVEGYLVAHYGDPQFDSSATVTVLEKGDGTYDDGKEDVTYNSFAEMVEAANKLKDNEKLGVTTTQTGTIIDEPSYYAKNDNWQFTMDVDGVEIYCYGVLKGEESVEKGGTVTITGDLTAYNGKAQFSYATVTEDSYTAPASTEPDTTEPSTEAPEETTEAPEETTEAPEETTEPVEETPEVATIADGTYLIVAGNQAMTTTGYNSGFGYPKGTEITWANNSVTGYVQDNIFTITNSSNGKFTIQDTDGVLLCGPSGTHTSFNFNASSATEWILCKTETDGVYTLKNVATEGTVAYSTGFGSYGVYAEPYDTDVATISLIAVSATAPEAPEDTTEAPEETTEPVEETPEVATIANGTYLIMCGNKAMTTVNKSYGYLPGTDITFADNQPTGYTQESIFTITNVTGGFTITDSNGKVLGASAEYKTFTVGATSASTYVAYKTATDGVYTIVNVDLNMTVCNDPSYGSFGNYAEVGDYLADIYLIAVPATAPETPDSGEGDEGETTTVTISIADVATANSWADSTLYASFTVDGVSVSSSGTPVGNNALNTGKYYSSNNSWRIYENEYPSIVITAGDKTIVSVKITYSIKKSGYLTFDGSKVTSKTVVDINAASAVFSVSGSAEAHNGNIQITSIEVIYK